MESLALDSFGIARLHLELHQVAFRPKSSLDWHMMGSFGGLNVSDEDWKHVSSSASDSEMQECISTKINSVHLIGIQV